MDFSRKCAYISNGYYNKGLKLAREGDLTNAAEALKKALEFNKRNTNARNLLALVYYRIGEVSDALVQWVISLNIQPSENDADRYLDELQRQQGLLDSYGQTIQKFNQALALAQGGSVDLAIIQLCKLVEHHPDYVRANTLLGLLYLGTDEPRKAFKCVQNALRTDKGSVIALKLLDAVRTAQREKQGKRKKLKDALSTDNKAAAAEPSIIAEPYKDNTVWSTVGNILIGLLIGAASILFVFLPIKEASMAKQYNEQVIAVSEKLNRVSSEVSDLENSNEELIEEKKELGASKREYEEDNMKRLSNLQTLAGAVDAYRSNRLTEGAGLYSLIDPRYMTDIEDGSSASVEMVYNELKNYYTGEGYDHFLQTGDKAYNAGNWDSAIDNFKICVMICPDRPEALFKEAMAYKRGGNAEHASELFNQIIKDFPDSEYADKAREARGV